MDSNWPRWIQASIIKYIKANAAAYPIYSDLDTQPPEQDPTRIEFAIAGPDVSEPSNTVFLTVRVSVLATAVKDDNDAYNIYRVQGEAQKAVPGCIPVYKFGDGVGDDRTVQLGILVRQDPVTTLEIGHQDKSNRLRQVGLIANYRMDL